MCEDIRFPGGLVARAAAEAERPEVRRPDWGIYADPCWRGWPGVLLDWPDYGLPSDDQAAARAIEEGFGRLREGQDVLVACRGGAGRTGTILACLAILAGVPTDLAIRWVRKWYRPDAVETPEQERWVLRFGEMDPVRRQMRKNQDRLTKADRERIRGEMRRALEAPDLQRLSPVLAWAIPGVLAVTQRPLRAHPDFGDAPDYPASARSEIEAWIGRLKAQGIRSVVVLTSENELRRYQAATAGEGGLLGLYERRGLQVTHIPADDPAHDVRARGAFDAAVGEIAREVDEVLEDLPLPAAMHCSAAIDRSPPVAALVAHRRALREAPENGEGR